jgi:hypothetical protein
LGFKFNLWLSIAGSLIVFFMDDTILNITNNDGSESMLIDGLSGTLDNLSEFILASLSQGVLTISNKVILG